MASASRLWAWPVRLSHWALAGLVLADFIEDSGDYTHRMIGYAAAGVVLARLMWGALSRSNGRLRDLVPSFPATWLYVGQLRTGMVPHPDGHNPLAIWMIWTLWTLVLLLGATGWMTRLDEFWGDETLHLVHALLADALLGCILVHVIAVAAMSLLLKQNLLAAMLFRRPRVRSSPRPR